MFMKRVANADEVELKQYKAPFGDQTRVFAPVGEEWARRAVDMVFACEVLTTGQVAIYGRRKGEPVEAERVELATNGPGPNEPVAVLRRLIEQIEKEKDN